MFLRTIRRLLIGSVAALMASVGHAEVKSIVFGVFPYVSSAQLVKFHEPLRARLENVLGRPVTMVTAPDIPEFAKRTAAGEYDFVLTAPHMGWIAESQNGYRNLVGSAHNIQGLFLANSASNIQSLSDLKGKSITMPTPMSIVYQMGLRELRNAGLQPGKDVTILLAKTHNNAMYAPARNESDAALTGHLMWAKLGAEYLDRLRVIGTTAEAPGFFFMANKRLPAAQSSAVREFLLNLADDPTAKEYFEISGFKAFILVNEKVRKSMAAYTDFSQL